MKCLKEVIEATGETSSIETITVKPPQKWKVKDGTTADPTDAIMKVAQEETDKKILKIWKTNKTIMEIKVRLGKMVLLNSRRIRLCQLTIFI